MQIGVVLPQLDLPDDPAGVRAYAEGVEGLGFAHILAYDHVVGADPAGHQGWQGPYDVNSTFHEPLVLYGYLAALTRLELVTGILILPQRQTVLVAKQAAEVDLLTGGRFRLGVGVGWNAVEYEALGMEFGDRGKRSGEAIEVLRRLWTERSVDHHGTYEHVTAAGIAPLPVQRPIPVWLGGASPAAYRRMGQLADGWFPMVRPGPDLDEARRIIADAATEAGRDAAAIGMEGRASWSSGGLDGVVEHIEAWQEAGATHLGVDTMNADLGGVDGHLQALTQVAQAVGLTSA